MNAALKLNELCRYYSGRASGSFSTNPMTTPAVVLLLVFPLLASWNPGIPPPPEKEEAECYCGQARRVEFGKTVDRIHGGTETEVGEYPWQVISNIITLPSL